MKNVKKVVVKKSKIGGKGVFAARDFKKGEFILSIDDSDVVFEKGKEVKKVTKHDLTYRVDYAGNGKYVRWGSPERYINHSCDPNVYTKTKKGIRNVLAMRNIKKGEEITFDYAINGPPWTTWKKKCKCGSKNCRGITHSNFFKLPRRVQRKYLPYLDSWFKKEFKKQLDKLKRQK